jgi:hypothetical protein
MYFAKFFDPEVSLDRERIVLQWQAILKFSATYPISEQDRGQLSIPDAANRLFTEANYPLPPIQGARRCESW